MKAVAVGLATAGPVSSLWLPHLRKKIPSLVLGRIGSVLSCGALHWKLVSDRQSCTEPREGRSVFQKAEWKQWHTY